MVPARQVDREAHMADLLLKSQAALEEVHQYYKVGRHAGKSIEKPYFLFSHCANLLFSLWLTENESPSGLFKHSSYLSALNSSLNFGALRYTDYVRRTLHANALQEHVKNEPKWFQFWLKMLESQEGSRPVDYQRFSREILKFVGHPGFLEGKAPKKSRKPVADLLKTDDAARIFQQSMTVLEESIRAVVSWLANLDQNQHASEQMASLICLLHQVRRTIINETPAQGPYVLLSNKDWGIPSTLFRVYSGRMRGSLKVVPKRDGGCIVCAYNWKSGTEAKCRSWTRDMTALTRPYEELLFKTWSYDTGEPLNPADPSSDSKACWLVQAAEARRLQAIFQDIDMVSRALAASPQCTGLTANVAGVCMKSLTEGQNTELAWTYVKKLDQLLNKLKFACREAQVLGGKNPGAEVISNMWPPEPSAALSEETSPDSRTSTPAPQFDASGRASEADTDEPDQDTGPDEASAVPGQEQPEHGETCGTRGEIPAGAEEPKNQSADEATTADQKWPLQESEAPEPASAKPDEVQCAAAEPEPHTTPTSETEETAEAALTSGAEDPETSCSDGLLIIDEPDGFDSAPFLSSSPASDTEPAQNEFAPAEPSAEDADQTAEQADAHRETAPSAQAVTTDGADEEPEPATERATQAQTDTEPVGSEEETPVEEEVLETPGSTNPETAQSRDVQSAPGRDPWPNEPHTGAADVATERAQETVSVSAVSSHMEEPTPDTTSLTNEPQAEVSISSLRGRLLQWHRPAGGPVNYEALSLKQLQQDLGWKQSEVQRTMTEIFGRRPFTVYKEQCQNETICAWLECSARPQTEVQASSADDSRSTAAVDIATSDRLFCEYVSQPRSSTGRIDSAGNRSGARQTTEAELAEMDRQLLDRLLEHHLGLNGPICNEPLSLKQLQQDLAWKASEVQRSMTRLFGKRPFTAYKTNCSQGTISAFLETDDRHDSDQAEGQEEMMDQHVPQTV